MYAFIRGIVAELGATYAVVDAGGVGYELFCSAKTLQTLCTGKEAKLLTHFHLAEGVMALYGFVGAEEREMFRMLISVTRVGPKLALSVLSVLSVQEIAFAIMTENASAFERVPGMGHKSAQRVLLELKEKVDAEQMLDWNVTSVDSASVRAQAIAALMSLGYDNLSATSAVQAVPEAPDHVEELITKALRSLAKH